MGSKWLPWERKMAGNGHEGNFYKAVYIRLTRENLRSPFFLLFYWVLLCLPRHLSPPSVVLYPGKFLSPPLLTLPMILLKSN